MVKPRLMCFYQICIIIECLKFCLCNELVAKCTDLCTRIHSGCCLWGKWLEPSPPPCSLSAWEPGGDPTPCHHCWLPSVRLLVAQLGPPLTHLSLVLPAHVFHHPTMVLLSLGPFRAGSTYTAGYCQHHITDACMFCTSS